MTLNWLNGSSIEIGGVTITLDYAINGSKIKSSDRDFTIMKVRNFSDHAGREPIKIRKAKRAAGKVFARQPRHGPDFIPL